ncbi:MAG TPA: diguanylate cyclase [Phycisphaerae bacterium]|nr:diguanylate cyclase [Phycisphaerae bacterium]
MQNSFEPNDRQESPLILVIDDAEDTMRLIVKTLQAAGFRTLWAEDGATGIVIAEKYQPDAVVLDLLMPDLDGYGVCEELKSRLTTADIPVLFLTGVTDTDDVIARCYQAGAHDLLTKPVRRVELVSRLQVVLRERALREVYKKLATQDPQTGVDNRRQTFLNITDGIISARRDQSDSALVLGDINNLTAVNQRHGYDFGDEIILTFARLLKRFVSADCKVGRIAGDTMAVVLKKTTRERAKEFCTRMERTFSSIAFDAGSSPKHFSASFGVSIYDGKDAAFDADEIMNEADLALVKAKFLGRGDVIAFWEIEEAEIPEIEKGKRRARKRRRIRSNHAFLAAPEEEPAPPAGSKDRRSQDVTQR